MLDDSVAVPPTSNPRWLRRRAVSCPTSKVPLRTSSAATLLELNPERTRVAIAAMNSIDWVVAMYACALAGMSVVAIQRLVQ
jgi:acyl-CoA synthetase (AMP-forming)/AMP-acid ligase II